MLLRVSNLDVVYGRVRAVQNASFSVKSGSITAILGSNGAGKTSILRSIAGLESPAAGEIEYPSGESIVGRRAHQIARSGIRLVPEGRDVFSTLSVAENLFMGAFVEKDRRIRSERLNEVFQLFPILKDRRNQEAGTLSGGEQQMLAIGRALMGDPRLIMMDEPSLGLAPQITQAVFEMTKRIRERGVTILMVEQNAHMALGVADAVVILEVGVVVASGAPNELGTIDEIVDSYLGS